MSTDKFRDAIAAAGLTPPDAIIDNGKFNRFSTNDKRSDTAGWYVFHGDGIPSGVFGCHRSGLQSSWSAINKADLTEAQRAQFTERRRAALVASNAAQKADHDAAAIMASTIWDAATPINGANWHGYLDTKGIQSHGARLIQAVNAHRLCNRLSPQLTGALLVIPIGTAGQLRSLQFITEDGTKRPLTGGEKRGCHHIVGKPGTTILIAEGFATGCSLNEATGHAAVVALDSGNLMNVALAMRAKFPGAKIILAGDDDHLTEGNPGLTSAREAAQAVGGLVAVPSFPAGRGDKDTDFNDLFKLAGAGAVKAGIDAADSGETEATAATGYLDPWPEPTPLPDELPPVAPFTPDLLPESLRPWVLDIAHRMQCPPDFTAVAALVALSSIIGARAVIQPKERDDWQVTPNLWGAIVGRPGVKKSPALGEALRPLNRLQADSFEANKAAHDDWELDCKVVAMQDEGNEKKAKSHAAKGETEAARFMLKPGEAPPEPVARRYIVNDATVEKLGELMQQNPWGTLSYRDELYGLLTSMDKQGQEGARAFYLQSYDGNQGYTFDRIMRGTVHIDRVCLAMIGGIQPGKIQEYVRGAMAGGTGDDGLLQRFGLTVWPDMTGDFVHVDQWPDTQAKQTAWAVFERLAGLQPGADDQPNVWRFTPGAQAIFVKWMISFETELRVDDLHPAMISHLAKYRKLIPALALVFALIDTPDSGGLIYENEITRALTWCDYLRPHAVRLYSAAVTPETTGASSLLAKINAGKLFDRDGLLLDGFTPRQVAQKGWAGLTTPDAVRKAADVLADYDWLRRDVVKSGAAGGRPSDRYSINPAAMTAGITDRLKISKAPNTDPTKPTKPINEPGKGGFVGFVGTPPAPFEIFHPEFGDEEATAGEDQSNDEEVF